MKEFGKKLKNDRTLKQTLGSLGPEPTNSQIELGFKIKTFKCVINYFNEQNDRKISRKHYKFSSKIH